MNNEELAMKTWIESNLGVTTATLSREAARRWLKLLMRDDSLFFQLAIYGFVGRRQEDLGNKSFPEQEFAEFCGEFVTKLRLVLQCKGQAHSVPMFKRIGVRTMQTLFQLHNQGELS